MTRILAFLRRLGIQLLVVAAAFLFALALYQTWDLKWRWFLVCTVGTAMVAVSMAFARIFGDFLMVAFFFLLPLTSFDKWVWPTIYSESDRGNLVYGGMLGLGMLDFILIGMYLSWFYRVFIARIQPFPRLCFLDLLAGGMLSVYVFSNIGTRDLELGLGATEFLFKYLLLYFYISRNLQPKHYAWLVSAICFSIVIQAGLGAYQHWTGKLVGFALDKGGGSATTLSFQSAVAGIENVKRATGTTYDSHALGNYLLMILPFPFVLFMTPWVKPFLRVALGLVTLLAIFAIVLSFSRSAWVACAIGMIAGFILIVLVWHEGTAMVVATVLAFFTIGSAPWTVYYIYERFKKSPLETITTRFKQWEVALTIWQRYPLLGTGPNNYINAMKRYDFLGLKIRPVHNVILQVLAESGLLGLLCYLGIFFSAIRRLFRVIRQRSDFTGRMAMAALIGLIGTLFDGITDPLFREPTVYATFWLLIGLAVALENVAPAHAAADLNPPEERAA